MSKIMEYTNLGDRKYIFGDDYQFKACLGSVQYLNSKEGGINGA